MKCKGNIFHFFSNQYNYNRTARNLNELGQEQEEIFEYGTVRTRWEIEKIHTSPRSSFIFIRPDPSFYYEYLVDAETFIGSDCDGKSYKSPEESLDLEKFLKDLTALNIDVIYLFPPSIGICKSFLMETTSFHCFFLRFALAEKGLPCHSGEQSCL